MSVVLYMISHEWDLTQDSLPFHGCFSPNAEQIFFKVPWCSAMSCTHPRSLVRSAVAKAFRECAASLHMRLFLQDAFVRNGALKSVLIFLIRFGNTFWGGSQWVQYAKLIGIQ